MYNKSSSDDSILSQQHVCEKLPKSVDVRWSYSVQHQCRFLRHSVCVCWVTLSIVWSFKLVENVTFSKSAHCCNVLCYKCWLDGGTQDVDKVHDGHERCRCGILSTSLDTVACNCFWNSAAHSWLSKVVYRVIVVQNTVCATTNSLSNIILILIVISCLSSFAVTYLASPWSSSNISSMMHWHIRCVPEKNSQFVFCHSFGKWTPIFAILSLWDFAGNFL